MHTSGHLEFESGIIVLTKKVHFLRQFGKQICKEPKRNISLPGIQLKEMGKGLVSCLGFGFLKYFFLLVK